MRLLSQLGLVLCVGIVSLLTGCDSNSPAQNVNLNKVGASGVGLTIDTYESRFRAQAGVRDVDALFEEIYNEHNSFAGFFIDDDVANVNIAYDPGDSELNQIRNIVTELLGYDRLNDQNIRFNIVEYDWRDLSIARERTYSLMVPLSPMSFDIDEVRNRVVIQVLPESDLSAFQAAAAELREDAEMVIIERGVLPVLQQVSQGVGRNRIDTQTHRVPYLASLRNRADFILGGYQIQSLAASNGNVASNCTIGFNALRNGVVGFVTASHCTASAFNYDNSEFYQNSIANSIDLVGNDAVDPSLMMGCFIGSRCRWSDAAFVQYVSGLSFGNGLVRGVAKPVSSGTTTAGSYMFTNKWKIWSHAPHSFVGQELAKIGRTTGFTIGTLRQMSVHFNYGSVAAYVPANTYLLSQDRYEIFAEPGDSGSPVVTVQRCSGIMGQCSHPAGFQIGVHAYLAGIHWAGVPPSGGFGDGWMSHMGGVAADLGTLDYIEQ